MIEDGHCKGSGGFPCAMTLRLEPRVWDSQDLALYSSRLGNWLSYQGARWRCTSAACVAKLDLGQKGESDFAGIPNCKNPEAWIQYAGPHEASKEISNNDKQMWGCDARV